MCGIAGLVNWGDAETLGRMADVQAHRGPDDRGVWEFEGRGDWLGLASRRLKIIDLSSAGHMPMASDDRRLWITYNGEVYNFPELRRELTARGHRFRSATDTEVVLRLYEQEGRACVSRLNGMFALAIADLRGPSPRLFLARDHFGVKPLYFVHRGRRLAFASEVKALLEVPDVEAEVDPAALDQFLTFLWVPDPRTMFRGVDKLPAGHYAVYEDGRLEIRQYWDLSFPPAGASYARSEPELIDEVRARFRRAVRSQMMGDVPVGAFLSAGLDSSSIVAMMAEAAPGPVRTYTITFPAASRAGERTLDDPAVARGVAEHFGCDHHEIVVEPDVARLLPELVWHMDEPIADPPIILSYLVAREARKTVTVLLSGVGGDEVFAGYRKHYSHAWSEAYRRLPAVVRRRVVEPAVNALPVLRGTPLMGSVRLAKKMMRSASLPPADRFLMNCTYFDAAERASLYAADVRAELGGADAWEGHRRYFDRVEHADFLHQMLYLDTKAFMVSLNLTYNDKMSMASSVEVRVPFLDRELVEFVAGHVPPHLKLRGFLHPTTKYVLRQAMRGILPPQVLRQPKAGFAAPLDRWLAVDLRELIDDLLTERQVRERGWFDPRAVRRLVEEHRRGRHDWSMRLWQLLTFELWMRAFGDRRGRAVARRP
jgi:asparagine synthase (glutamine-hydrolysing)